MGQPLEITRTELSAPALRALAGKTDDGAVVRRLLGESARQRDPTGVTPNFQRHPKRVRVCIGRHGKGG